MGLPPGSIATGITWTPEGCSGMAWLQPGPVAHPPPGAGSGCAAATAHCAWRCCTAGARAHGDWLPIECTEALNASRCWLPAEGTDALNTFRRASPKAIPSAGGGGDDSCRATETATGPAWCAAAALTRRASTMGEPLQSEEGFGLEAAGPRCIPGIGGASPYGRATSLTAEAADRW